MVPLVLTFYVFVQNYFFPVLVIGFAIREKSKENEGREKKLSVNNILTVKKLIIMSMNSI